MSTQTMRKAILIVTLTLLTIFAIAQDTIRLSPYVGKLKTMKVFIGEKQYSFLFDTGGGETFISPEIAATLNKIPYSKLYGTRMNGEAIFYQKCDSIYLNLGATTIFHSTLGVWDIMIVLPKELPKIDGIISLKTFRNKIISLDLDHNKIVIETPKTYSRKVKNMAALQSRFASGPSGNELTLFLGTKHNKRVYWFLFDSGNLKGFIFSPQTAYEWGLQADTVSIEKKYETEIALGSKRYNVSIVTEKIIYEGAIDYDFIAQRIYFIDLIKNQVYVNP